MADRSFMPMYWGDYLRDTQHLSTEEHGAYLLLLAHYWSTGCPLPDDERKLAKICRLSEYKFKKIFPALVDFFSRNDGRLFQKRLDEELEKHQRISQLRSEAGKKGGRPRKANGFSGESKKKPMLPSTTTTNNKRDFMKFENDDWVREKGKNFRELRRSDFDEAEWHALASWQKTSIMGRSP